MPDFGFILPLLIVLVVVGVLMFVVRQYKRCPSNRILVVYGKVGGQQAARCIHGGGVFIVPLFQDYQYMSLEPMAIDIELTGGLTLGMTVVDLREPAGPEVTTQVAFDLDHARFWALVVDALERIGDPVVE